MALVYCLFLANDSDTFATARCIWLHNVHVLKVTCLAVNHPSLVVLREDVSRWSNVKSLPVQPAHPLHVPPHVVFPTDCPGAREVIYMLLRVHVPQTALPEETGPDDIPSGPSHMPKAGHLQGVHHAVIGMSAVRNFEAWSAIWLKLLLVELNDPAIV